VSDVVITQDDPGAPDVRALLERHLAFAFASSPHADVHALDSTRLAVPDITFFGARDGGQLLGVGAIKELDLAHAELKSMHTAIEARGRGIGRAMVHHLLGVARERGYRRVSLETGTGDPFAAALALYDSVGFTRCEPFADYQVSDFSTFMTLELT
jgi:putative acetyltransferase